MALANGDISVQRSVLPEGEAGVDATVAKMVEMAKGQYGARSAKIRALAINIINAARVADKDYFGMAKAIHTWVRDQIRYVRDPIGQETLSYPEETAFNTRAEDCLDGDTRLLTPAGYKAIRDIREGDIIQGRLGWTKVVAWYDKGELPTYRVLLDNGASFTATGEHQCFLLDGSETTVDRLAEDDALLGPSTIELPPSSDFLTDDDYHFVGLYLADGWCSDNKTCIAGKDGFVKEAQKRWVAAWAEKKGWRTNWQSRYITVYIPKDHALYDLLHDGKLAPEKAIPDVLLRGLTATKAARLLDGILADCHRPMFSQRAIGAELSRKKRTRSGVCYSTTSPDLAKQVRLLFRVVHGVSVRDTLVVNHGGLGTHPVHRIYPRFYRDKPARVDAVEAFDVRHVYDITTEDQGIYLPDADVVVHNCDGKTILEMALLGSIGISSYPVVVGMQPGRYSHVYLHIVIPPGTGRYAGATIAADPIMREWPLGKEVPDSKVKAKKLYSELSGLLGMNLGAYASGSDYLDVQNLDSVGPALRSKMVDTGARGRVMNTAEVTRPSDDLDDMFVRGSTTLMPFTQAHGYDLHQLGPVTARGAQLSTSFLDEIKPRQLRERRAGPKLVTVRNRKNRAAAPTVSSAPTLRELRGLGDYLAALEPVVKNAAARNTVMGKHDVLIKAAAAASLANQRARKASRRVVQMHRSIGMFGLGAEVSADDVKAAESIASLAHALADKAAALAKASTGGAPERTNALRAVFSMMERAEQILGNTTRVEAMVGNTSAYPAQDAATKVAAITDLVDNPEIAYAANRRLSVARDVAEREMTKSPLLNPMPGAAVVRDRNGEAIYSADEDGTAGLGFSLKKTFKKIRKVADKVVPEAHLMKLTRNAISSISQKSPLLKPLVKNSAILRKVLDVPGPNKSHAPAATSDGKFYDANGNAITKAQYDALVAQMAQDQATYNAAIAAINSAISMGAKPSLTPEQVAVLQKYDVGAYQQYLAIMSAQTAITPSQIIPQPTSAGPSGMVTGGGTPYAGGSMPVPQSSQPIDTFGPEDMSQAYDASGGQSMTQTGTATGYDPAQMDAGGGDDGGDASEGTLYTDDGGAPVDENGDPIPQAAAAQPDPTPAAAPAPAAGGLMPLAAIGGLLWYFAKKH